MTDAARPYQPSRPPAGFGQPSPAAMFPAEEIRSAINREMTRHQLLAVEIARQIQKNLRDLDQIQSTSWSADAPRVELELVDGSTFSIVVEPTT